MTCSPVDTVRTAFYNGGMNVRRCGKSGILLSELSLGFWHNFGAEASREDNARLLGRALELGITSFDLANNYGPPPGAAEERMGDLLSREFAAHRDEMFIATKAGHLMWNGPYGDWGSRKHLLASLDQSLKRLRLDYVDVFYSHRPDPQTPLEETMGALVTAVKSGRALYAGLSKYSPSQTYRACALLREAGVPCLVHQVRYNMLDRDPEHGLFDALRQEGVGCVAFSPLAQGMLTGKYLHGMPSDSRAAGPSVFLNPETVAGKRDKVEALSIIADRAGLSLTELAIRWILRRPEVASVIIGARNIRQLESCAGALSTLPLPEDVVAAVAAVGVDR